MAVLTIRNFDDAAKAKLKARAQANGRSMEAEARHALYEILETAPKRRDLSKIKPILPPTPEGFDWFETDEEELPEWERK